jgi:hypothetical protein
MDPRVKISSTELEKKFKAEAHLASIVSETSLAVMQANSIREQLEKLNAPSDAAKEAIHKFQGQLGAILGKAPGFLQPPSEEITLMRVSGQASALYGQVWQVDAAPTTAQSTAVAALERESVDVLKRWHNLKDTDLAALNRQLHDAGLGEVEIQGNLHYSEQILDEE